MSNGHSTAEVCTHVVEHNGIVILAIELQALTQPRSEHKKMLICQEASEVMKAELDQAEIALPLAFQGKACLGLQRRL